MPDTTHTSTQPVSALGPVPDGEVRREIAERVRITAAHVARHRVGPVAQTNNGEADAAAGSGDAPDFVPAHGTFTKGLEHDEYGRARAGDIATYIEVLNQEPANPIQIGESPFPGVYAGPDAGKGARFKADLYGGEFWRPSGSKTARAWESPLAGHYFDLEGADADQVAMPPAPALGSDELTAEMAEVYGAALLRDVPFTAWGEHAHAQTVAGMIADLPYFKDAAQHGHPGRRRVARGEISAEALFRGSTPGAKAGPYISQFMLVGNDERPSPGPDGVETSPEGADVHGDALNRASCFVPRGMAEAMSVGDGPVEARDGFIRYGIQVIPQRFAGHLEGVDHMTEWKTWLDVQNGSNRKDHFDRYEEEARFIATPRDLATYVHFDALYQAYLNACLLLLGAGQPLDIGLPEGAGHPTRDGFASFGGPHVLTLVTEVATRALKAVRRQKYNIHLRSRPEAVAAAISLAWRGGAAADSLGPQKGALEEMAADLAGTGMLHKICARNAARNEFWKGQYGDVHLGPLTEETNALLPMAFPEGSPMHPAYGAGHATVAGACVTVLKAFFEMFHVSGTPGEIPLYDIVDKHGGWPGTCPAHLFGKERHLTGEGAMLPHPYEPDPDDDHKSLRQAECAHLTTQGELDKLAANISIGRNFAGVHYYTDYYESLRMGERIAVSILQEQMLTYREPVSMRFTSFDGDRMMIAGTGGSRGRNDALVMVWDEDGGGGTEQAFRDWWTRHH
jgi:hypothetical protein